MPSFTVSCPCLDLKILILQREVSLHLPQKYFQPVGRIHHFGKTRVNPQIHQGFI
jgi:hypothetical protein